MVTYRFPTLRAAARVRVLDVGGQSVSRACVQPSLREHLGEEAVASALPMREGADGRHLREELVERGWVGQERKERRGRARWPVSGYGVIVSECVQGH